MSLSEKQLLLLDNLMYSDLTVTGSKYLSLGEMIDKLKVNGKVTENSIEGMVLSGGMSKKEMAEILNEISSDPDLSALECYASIDDGIRGTCFLNPLGEATVAFRGTGGTYEQWYDNLEGYGEIATAEQLKAKEFIDGLECGDITVTGHSKGGNLAMFVTTVCGDKISECVAYEGQ